MEGYGTLHAIIIWVARGGDEVERRGTSLVGRYVPEWYKQLLDTSKVDMASQ